MSQQVGFYFMLFQSQLNGYVKCWTDGNETYDLYTYGELFNILDKLNDGNLQLQMSQALESASFYLWNVMEGTVTLVRPDRSTSGIREMLNNVSLNYGKKSDSQNGVIEIPKLY